MIKRKFKQYRGYECLNCETPLDISEKYCHHCGQLNSTKRLTINDFIEEFLSNFYAYDSRLRNSIISIFTKPGILAKEFNEGKRQKYANPFRLFLSVSILLFISYNIAEKFSNKSTSNLNNQNLINSKELSEGLNQINDSIPNVEKKLIKDQIDSFQNLSKDSIYTKTELDKNSLGFFYQISSFRNYNLKYPNKTDEQALKELGYENNRYNRFYYAKSKLFKTNNIKDELAGYFYQKLPFLIFLSLPIITIIFWLVFYSKKLNYTEHLIFSYTFFTFLFICMILFYIIALFSSSVSEFLIGISSLIIFPLYLYKSLRNFYEQNRWKTILKFIFLNPLFGIFLLISSLIMIFLGIILF
jgi:hypothetical protein